MKDIPPQIFVIYFRFEAKVDKLANREKFMTTRLVQENIHLILASGSPRRKDLLESIGVRFVVIPSDVDETFLPSETPIEGVKRLSLEKALEISAKYPGYWIIGADTVVVIDGKVLGKPVDEDDAKIMLRSLNGTTHVVYTGFSLVNSLWVEKAVTGCSRSEVFIRSMSDEEIDEYVASGEPMDKAGAYAIQGLGSALVQSINGSYTNVVGLPLCEVARELKRLNVYDFLKAPRS